MKKITILLLFFISAFTFAQPGTIDFTFNAAGSGPDTAVYTNATQPDGKVIIAGTFDNYNGVTRSGIARLNADGSLDTSFDPGTGLALSADNIYCLALQTDGKILIGGDFANFNGIARKNIARLNADGSVDTSFDPGISANSTVVTISLQSTGKIIAGGLFTTFNAVAKRGLVRLNDDGTIDTAFLVGIGVNSYVWTTSVLPDDRIYIGGGFTAYNGVNCNHLTRLTAAGALDTSFTQVRYTNNSVLAHAVQPDGKIVIGGYFTTYGVASTNRLARINEDGTLDPTFNVGTGINNYPLTIVCQPNGKVLVGGAFTLYNGTTANRIMRLNNDASVDASFISGTGLNGILYLARFQPDGKILLSTGATDYNGNTTRPNLTKINGYATNAIAISSLSATAPFCLGQTLDVNYTAQGYYLAGNTFTAQLSDASGSFTVPTTIGSLSSVVDGTISVAIPALATPGSGYRIRVISSALATIGADNGTDLTIAAPTTYYADSDGDGYGNAAITQSTCAGLPTGYVTTGTDCDDTNPAVNPGAAEILYDGIDNNCNGNADEGSSLTTSLLPVNCGSTLASINSLIGITTVPVHYITGYRIRLTNGAQVQVIENNVPHFTLTQFPIYEYATTYTVDIQLQVNGFWLGYYGPTCLVSSPAILAEGGAAQILPSQCGITLAKINTLIATTSLPGVSGYRFQVTNLTDISGPNAIQTIDRTQNWFSLQMLTRYNYATTYRIEIAVKTGSGTFGGFGAPCEISTPSIGLSNCGAIVPSLTSAISTPSISGAMQYRFLVVRQSDAASTTIDRTTNYFTFNNVSAINFTAGALYDVSVAAMTSGTWSPYGSACSITAPGAAAKGTAAVASETITTNNFKATAYPNPFSSYFAIDVTASDAIVQLKVYDMLGRLVETKEEKASELNALKLGEHYPSGIYNIIISEKDVVNSLRVIKR